MLSVLVGLVFFGSNVYVEGLVVVVKCVEVSMLVIG